MKILCTRLASVAALVLLTAGPALAQKQVKPADADLKAPEIYRLTVYNGPNRSVHYVTNSYMSPSDQEALRNLERAENELILVDQLLALRSQYVADERVLEAKRRTMQELLYGYNNTDSYSLSGTGSNYYTTFPTPLFGYNGIYGAWGRGYGYGDYASALSTTTNHTLAVGVGPEGAIKEALATSLTAPAIADMSSAASRGYHAALSRVYDIERVREGMGLPKVRVADVPAGPHTVYLTDGSKITGTIVKEDADWITIKVGMGKEAVQEKVRTSLVTRITRADGAVAPADNK